MYSKKPILYYCNYPGFILHVLQPLHESAPINYSVVIGVKYKLHVSCKFLTFVAYCFLVSTAVSSLAKSSAAFGFAVSV